MTAQENFVGDVEDVLRQNVESTYDQLGLRSAVDRARFSQWFMNERPTVQFDVVIGTTSSPYHA